MFDAITSYWNSQATFLLCIKQCFLWVTLSCTYGAIQCSLWAIVWSTSLSLSIYKQSICTVDHLMTNHNLWLVHNNNLSGSVDDQLKNFFAEYGTANTIWFSWWSIKTLLMTCPMYEPAILIGYTDTQIFPAELFHKWNNAVWVLHMKTDSRLQKIVHVTCNKQCEKIVKNKALKIIQLHFLRHKTKNINMIVFLLLVCSQIIIFYEAGNGSSLITTSPFWVSGIVIRVDGVLLLYN